jgi:oxygen tolerance protein BatD
MVKHARRGFTATLTLGLALMIFPALALAQGPPVVASVDRAVVRANESFVYVLRAEGTVTGDPEIAPLAAQFDILNAPSSSRSIGIVNGRRSEVYEWQFPLMPKAPGEFTIPALRVGDRQSNPVAVRVLPAAAGTGPAADIFMELDAEPEVAYAQAQIVFTLRLYIGVTTGRATLTAPEIGGVEAIVEKLGEDSRFNASRGGRDFIVQERRYAVFPQQAGTMTIGPVTFEAMVIPDRGFSRVQRFRSDVLEVAVQPAVAPPAELAGAAWLPAQRVTLTEDWGEEGDELTVGIPRTRTIVIEGAGLLETQLPDLTLEQLPGIRQYADQPELERSVTPEGFVSRRRVSFAVIAQAPGDVALGSVRLPWWNVAAQRWEVAELLPRTLHVRPSAEEALPEPAAVSAGAAPATGSTSGIWPLLSAALALGWVATILAWWRARTRQASAPAPAAPAAARRPALRKILRDLNAACAVGDAAGARNALLAFGEARFTDAPPRSLGALAALLPEVVAREVLALEAHIYGQGPKAWRGDALAAVLGELEKAGMASELPPEDPLMPLYR